MKHIFDKHRILFSEDINITLNKAISELNPDKIFVLTDENTLKFCLPKININNDFQLIEIKSGELNKNIGTVKFIWRYLTRENASRKSLLVNLGGGVIGDMGGFAAAAYKRGMFVINIPTTLLAQVDASVGGKTGIDFMGFKNQIGFFRQPDFVIIDSIFLDTLPEREFWSGYVEMLKHGIIYDENYFLQLSQIHKKVRKDKKLLTELVLKSVEIKSKITDADPYESGLRKILNFGHTIGHAIEAVSLSTKKRTILHGEAVLAGMICELYLSNKLAGLALNDMLMAVEKLSVFDTIVRIDNIEDIIERMKQDKKNSEMQINCSLVRHIGDAVTDYICSVSDIREAIGFYNQLKK